MQGPAARRFGEIGSGRDVKLDLPQLTVSLLGQSESDFAVQGNPVDEIAVRGNRFEIRRSFQRAATTLQH